MMTIIWYSAQFHLACGVENVTKGLYGLLPRADIKMHLVCEFGCPDWVPPGELTNLSQIRTERNRAWDELARKIRPICVVFNHISGPYVALTLDDIQYLHSLGVKCVRMMHSTFVSPQMSPGCERDVWSVNHYAQMCDAVFTVSHVDALWWTALGHRSVSIQNPIRLPALPEGVCRDSEAFTLIWVGRQDVTKQPNVAFEAFARAAVLNEKLRLIMIGGSDKGWDPLRRQARRLKLTSRVEFLKTQSDIGSLWARADAHLLTSTNESFCLVLAESKSVGIPTVMFEIPFLELAASRQGIVSVPQGDVAALAEQIVALSKDPGRAARLGMEAKSSLAGFGEEKVLSDWRRALVAVMTGEGFLSVSDDAVVLSRQQFMAWNSYCNRNLWLVRMEGNARRLGFSLRWLSKILEWLVCLARKVRIR